MANKNKNKKHIPTLTTIFELMLLFAILALVIWAIFGLLIGNTETSEPVSVIETKSDTEVSSSETDSTEEADSASLFGLNPDNYDNTQVELNETARKFIEEMGMDPDNDTIQDVNGTGLTLVGNAKVVNQYRSLHEAETDMGYYLGLHNTLESWPNYELVGMYNIGNEWYQAIYEDVIGERASITLKVSKTATLEDLTEAYDFDLYDERDIVYESELGDISGKIYVGKEDKLEHLICFETANNKKYTLFTFDGVADEVLTNVFYELAANLQIMVDWI